jgi:tRNA(Ile)-lysidine synthetase-like protein
MASGSGEGSLPDALDLTHLPIGGPLVVAVSGGADSMALWSLLARLDRWQLVVWHLDHSIRAESPRDAELVRDCPLPGERQIERADIPALAAAWGCGLEEAGRRHRYARLAAIAAATGASTVVTGHHRDDQAETILLNLIRGSRGLVGMPERRELSPGISVVRPLLRIARKELREWLARAGIPWHEDLSNDDPGFARNRVRHAVLPTFAVVPGFTEALIAGMRTTETPLRAWLRQRALPVSRAIIRRLEQLGVGERTAMAGRLITRTDQGWRDEPEAPAPLPQPRWRSATAEDLRDLRRAIVVARVQPPLVWRHPVPGERWRPLGAPGNHSVFHSLAARRVPARARRCAWVLADSLGPVWVGHCTIANRCRVLPQEDPATCILIELPTNWPPAPFA